MKLGRFELNDVYLEDSYKAIKEKEENAKKGIIDLFDFNWEEE